MLVGFAQPARGDPPACLVPLKIHQDEDDVLLAVEPLHGRYLHLGLFDGPRGAGKDESGAFFRPRFDEPHDEPRDELGRIQQTVSVAFDLPLDFRIVGTCLELLLNELRTGHLLEAVLFHQQQSLGVLARARYADEENRLWLHASLHADHLTRGMGKEKRVL